MRKKSEILEAFAPREDLANHDSFFLVGIGGAGMSALAKMLKDRGKQVRGTDSTASAVTAELIAEGIDVHIGHTGDPIQPGDAVILTDAIDLTVSPEVKRARELGCRLFRRSQLLGYLLEGKKTIGITGTHGKTTTTGLTGSALIENGFDPLIVVGAAIPAWGSPVREGNGEWAVVEACEAYDSFHDLDPAIVVLTNLELDHSDFHGDYESLRASVLRFVNRASIGLVYCAEDQGACEVAALAEVPNKIPYRRVDAALALPGEHNRLNAGGALAAASLAGASEELALTGISRFTGAERRLQVHREGPITVIDDYAHHPSEIEASLKALRERYPDRRLIVVYQPHLYSRTKDFLPQFAEALNLADVVVLTDIYPAREDPIPGISSARIAEGVSKPVRYVPSRFLLPREVAGMAKPGDLVVGMGAGTIGDFVPDFLRELDRTGAIRVAVLEGGDSAEREVSLLSGRAIAKALESKGYEVTRIDVTERLLSRGDLSFLMGSDRPDVAFLAVHGTNAEDGAIQGLCEMLHIPYTGSGIQSSALSMDKERTKLILEAHGLPVVKGISISSHENPLSAAVASYRREDHQEPENSSKKAEDQMRAAVASYRREDHQEPEDSNNETEDPMRAAVASYRRGYDQLTYPLVVKPNAQGSTVGLSFVDTPEELEKAITYALQFDSSAIIEERIIGMEISVPVLGDRALPPVEIVPASGSYDFASKYEPGATEEICPARLPDEVLRKAQDLALKTHRAMGCEGATRTDMMVRLDPEPELFILEINTLPGMTGTSLLPNSAKTVGIDFPELCDWIVQDALRRHGVQK